MVFCLKAQLRDFANNLGSQIIGGSRGARPGARPPYGSRFFRFDMQKFLKRSHLGGPWPPVWGPRPPHGKSWICHCRLRTTDTGNSMFLCLCLSLCHSIFSKTGLPKKFSVLWKSCSCHANFKPIRKKYFFSPNIGSVFGTPCVNPNCTLQNVFQAGGCHSSSGVWYHGFIRTQSINKWQVIQINELH